MAAETIIAAKFCTLWNFRIFFFDVFDQTEEQQYNLLKTKALIIFSKVWVSKMYFTLMIWRCAAVQAETLLVICSSYLKVSSTYTQTSFAEGIGDNLFLQQG